jgi:hypothetical protein
MMGCDNTFANFVKASLPVETSSRKPKPMHIVKKRGIIPDGLVQTVDKSGDGEYK